MPSTLFSIGSDFFLSEFQNFSTPRLECFQTIFLSIACSNLEILSIVFETEPLWRDYYIQPSKSKITVNPKTVKNCPTYSQGTKLLIFNGFWGLE